MDPNLSSLITEAGNLAFVLGALAIVAFAIRWHAKNHISAAAKSFTNAILMICVATGVRIGYWAVALDLAPLGHVYHPAFIENKAIVTTITAVLFTVGVVQFVGTIEGFRPRTKVGQFLMTFLIAGFLALM